ncbi:hypothetical protein NERG_00348 [Nematocida ausubeli]|uniref:Calponin-homology (CH) domain-containing protein n=1 Tax=Nematocida ausubeli (strain ATCC PRA-371 / ERTm2) TaxID=1913371 RepID=H8Z9S7_NEMA1|nr:hypothetical protein NERG_00348 [Nematocida ausubeli]
MQEGIYYSTIEEDRMLSAEELDRERSRNKIYEYLCRMQEAREWIENIIQEKIPDEFENALRNGVYLARLVSLFKPELAMKIFTDEVLQYRHTDNINVFFTFAKTIGLPSVFLFDLVDLYEHKNIPKVVYCILALAHYLSKKKIAIRPSNLVGRAIFTEDQIRKKEKEIEEAGISLPSFGDIQNAVNIRGHSKKQPSNEGADKEQKDTAERQEVSAVVESEKTIDFNESPEMKSMVEGSPMEISVDRSVQTVQSCARTLLSQQAFLELSGASPVSIFTLRRSLHLLHGGEEKEEAVVEELNRILSLLFSENAELEKQVTLTENKISLLLRNMIQQSPSELCEKRPYMKYKTLQRLFARLQDDPAVITALVTSMRQREAEAFCSARLLPLFGHAKTPREEYAYLRIVEALVHAPRGYPLAALAVRALVISQDRTPVQKEILEMLIEARAREVQAESAPKSTNQSVHSGRSSGPSRIGENKTLVRVICSLVLDRPGDLPYAVRFYARTLSRALRADGKSEEEVAQQVVEALWIAHFMPALDKVCAVQDILPALLAYSDRIVEYVQLASGVESIAAHYTGQYIAARPMNNMLCITGEDVNYLLAALLKAPVAGDIKGIAADCHPIPFKLVFILPGGAVRAQETIGATEKRMCKWALIKILSHTRGKRLSEIIQGPSGKANSAIKTAQPKQEVESSDLANELKKALKIKGSVVQKEIINSMDDMVIDSPYKQDSEKAVEAAREAVKRYSQRLFDLGCIRSLEDCAEILQAVSAEIVNRVQLSISRKREIKATEKAIYSLERAREVIERRMKEGIQYLHDVTVRIMQDSREYKRSAKALLLEGVIVRMYSWQAGQMDNIEMSLKVGDAGSIVVSILVIGIQSVTEKIELADLLVLDSQGEEEISVETLGTVFSVQKLVALINKKILQ